MTMEKSEISKSTARKASSALILLSIGLIVSGTKACQEDYALGSQATVNTTTTPTATPTEDGGGAEPSPTPTATGSVTASPSPTPTQDTAGMANNSGQGGVNGSLYQELSALSNQSPAEIAGAAAQGAKSGKGENWLGQGFGNRKNSANSEWQDTDGDGFSDAVEEAADTEVGSAVSSPEWILTSVLDKRVKAKDSDMDGIADRDEAEFGSDPHLMDTDGDGRTDGAEKLSGGDPRSPQDTYVDSDSDGLSDEYEDEKGLNPRSLDTDGDGLRDDTEIAIGSDPLKIDSDGDGVADGKEFDLGADPTVVDGK